MTSFPTRQKWFDKALQTYDDFLRALRRFGMAVSPDLRIIQDDCLFCYYDPSRNVIAFSIPDPQTPKGRLAWHFYLNIVAAPTFEDLFEFSRITLPRIVAHEVTHHLRDWYGTATKSDWVEEHVANTVASAYTQGMFENHRSFLKPYLERAVAKLKSLNDQCRNIQASYQDIAQVLVDQPHGMGEMGWGAAIVGRLF